MKRLIFFSRAYTVPGGAKFNPEHGPMRESLVSRVVYRMYPDDKAVVYSGIDQGMPTKVAAGVIIGLIASAEQFDPIGWSFFDLLTSMSGDPDQIDPGDYEFHLISWRMENTTILVEGSILLECPESVQDDFDHYINSVYYADDRAILPSRDDDDGEEEKRDEHSRPNPPAPGSQN